MLWYSHLFRNFPQFVVIHTVKAFNVVIEADVLGLNDQDNQNDVLIHLEPDIVECEVKRALESITMLYIALQLVEVMQILLSYLKC